ncbi:hypothetical protein [Phyllobacterium sp. K27]
MLTIKLNRSHAPEQLDERNDLAGFGDFLNHTADVAKGLPL